MSKPRIRPIALGLIQHQGHVFVSPGLDQADDTTFYRFLGGGIDFGEPSETALKREFQEEIQAELTQIEYLGCLENIFTCDGKPGHELIQLFRGQFVDPAFYQLDTTFTLIEGKRNKEAIWIPIEQIRSGALNLVPQSCHQFIR
jgi:8-oxo-dGTP pyrophosphatase MutT (NUDIX family)